MSAPPRAGVQLRLPRAGLEGEGAASCREGGLGPGHRPHIWPQGSSDCSVTAAPATTPTARPALGNYERVEVCGASRGK